MYFDLSPILIILILSISLLILVFYLMLRAIKFYKFNKPVIDHLNIVGDKIQRLSEGQERLTGGLQTVSSQAKAQLSMINMMEERLAKSTSDEENLSHSSRTAQYLVILPAT